MCFCLHFCMFFFSMTLGSHDHEDHRQYAKYKCLNDTYEQLEHENHGGHDTESAQQRSHHRNKHDAGKHIAK